MAFTWCLVALVQAFVSLMCFAHGEDVLTFQMLGDWGGTQLPPHYSTAQAEVAEQMGIKGDEIGSSFTLALGDNFYLLGVQNVDDPRFDETFEDVFTAPSLQKPWYVLAGNHDHYGNVSAQIAYTDKSDRWNFPELYYTKIFPIGDSGTEVQFVFIDTVVLAGLTHPTKRWLPPSGPASLNAAEDQWEWIEKTLATSTAKWLIVMGHYPVWSAAEHGPTELLVERLRPLLMQYNVTAYFCGHDHDAQHIHESDSTVEYFVTGAAHKTNALLNNIDAIPPDSLLFSFGVADPNKLHGAFNWVSIDSNTMNTTFVDEQGNDLYFYMKKPTRN